MEISVHEVENKINVSVVLCADHVLEANDVLVAVELLKEDNFTECPLGISGILKGVKVLLKSNDVLGLLVYGFPHNTISSLAYTKNKISEIKDSEK